MLHACQFEMGQLVGWLGPNAFVRPSGSGNLIVDGEEASRQEYISRDGFVLVNSIDHGADEDIRLLSPGLKSSVKLKCEDHALPHCFSFQGLQGRATRKMIARLEGLLPVIDTYWLPGAAFGGCGLLRLDWWDCWQARGW